jgi:hypothetical protein
MEDAVVLIGRPAAIECEALVELRRFFGNRGLLEQV